MSDLEFENLPNRKIKFITYTGKIIIGGNVTDYNEKKQHYIQTDFKNSESLSKEEKIKKGVLIPIKPSIIEEAIVIS